MTTEQLALDCDLRQHEMRDLRDQGPGPVALWTAHNVPTGRYL